MPLSTASARHREIKVGSIRAGQGSSALPATAYLFCDGGQMRRQPRLTFGSGDDLVVIEVSQVDGSAGGRFEYWRAIIAKLASDIVVRS